MKAVPKVRPFFVDIYPYGLGLFVVLLPRELFRSIK